MYFHYQVFKDSTLIGGFVCSADDLAGCLRSAILSGFSVKVYNMSLDANPDNLLY